MCSFFPYFIQMYTFSLECDNFTRILKIAFFSPKNCIPTDLFRQNESNTLNSELNKAFVYDQLKIDLV